MAGRGRAWLVASVGASNDGLQTTDQSWLTAAALAADGNGMPNWWEGLNISSSAPSTSNAPNGAAHDLNGDGVSNFDEWLADTRANDPNSFFHISPVGHEGHVTVLESRSAPIRRYYARFGPGLNTALTNILSFDCTGDFDADGMTDLDEFRAGTLPNDPNSALRILPDPSVAGGGVTVLWQSVPGQTYRLQFKNALADADWTDVSGDVTADGATASQTDTTATGQFSRFYRILLLP